MTTKVELCALTTPELQQHIAQLEYLLAQARIEQWARSIQTPDYSPTPTEEQLAREDLDSPEPESYWGQPYTKPSATVTQNGTPIAHSFQNCGLPGR